MDLLTYIPILAAESGGEEGGGSFLVTPGVGLMIWTLLAFGIILCILRKLAFPRIAETLDKRQQAIEESIDAAERTKREADELLAEYRERLTRPASRPRTSSPAPARPARHTSASRSSRRARQREELMEQTRRDIEAETRRAIQEIRNEVADLTVLATEKVTRKTLTEDDQRRLVEEALGELDFDALAGDQGAQLDGGDRRGLRPRRCSRSAKEQDKLDDVREQLGEFADALSENRDLQVFFFSPYFSTDEKKDGLDKVARRRRRDRR